MHSISDEAHYDPEIQRIFGLWSRLDQEIFTPNPGESVLERMATDAWESQDPRIRAAWEELTDPTNLPALTEWAAQSNMHAEARRASDMALRICRERAAGQP
ncbi:MAG: hypothetical protein HY720_02610 [Planctomycetes bacterium]|nr:hypothetical protein [Planctomycetota bacterium]